jgi:hypothetical protein
MNLLQKLTSLFHRPATAPLTHAEATARWQNLQEDPGKFIFEADGIRYPFKEHDEKLKWTDIERITAHKLDLFTIDEIRIDIFSGEGKITFSESIPGWHRLLTQLKTIFPSIPENWDGEITQPPFATNFRVLYEREDSQMPETTNFYAWLRLKNPELVTTKFQQASWHIHKSGRTEWEMSNTWAELHLEPDSDGLLLNGLVAFHPSNVDQLDRMLAGLRVPYKYEYYDNEKQLLLEKMFP